VFGLRRVLGIPSLLYAVISLVIPFVHDFTSADLTRHRAWHAARHLRAGNVDDCVSQFADPLVAFRRSRSMPFVSASALDSGTSLVGFYVDRWGWQWLYWQSVVIAPLMGLMVISARPASRSTGCLLARRRPLGGMLLLGTSVSMIYAGLDQGNRLDWLESGTVMALLLGGCRAVHRFSHQRGVGFASPGRM